MTRRTERTLTETERAFFAPELQDLAEIQREARAFAVETQRRMAAAMDRIGRLAQALEPRCAAGALKFDPERLEYFAEDES